MNQEQVLEEKGLFQQVSELKTQFNKYKETWSIAEFDALIVELKKLIKPTDYDRLFAYCKQAHPEIVQAAKDFRSRLEKKDNQICIEGETGSGKSTLALTFYVCLAHVMEQRVDLEKNVLYLPKEKELSNKLTHLKEYEILWVDESIKSLNKQKWMHVDVIDSNETIQTERFRHNTIIYCVPSFNELAKSFRDVNVKFRIWCINLQRAILRVKEIDPDICFKYGAWHSDFRAKVKIEKKVNSMMDIERRVAIERSLPGYVTDFSWPDLENHPDFAQLHLLYEVYKKRSRRIVQEQMIVKEDQARTKTQVKQMTTVINFMANAIRDGITWEDWFEKNRNLSDDGGLAPLTLQNYWREAKAKVDPSARDKETSRFLAHTLNPSIYNLPNFPKIHPETA